MKNIMALVLALVVALCSATCVAEGLMVGSWQVADDTAVTEDTQALLDKALDGFVGSSIEPVAYLGSQLVAGTNHVLLCKVTPVVPESVTHLALVYIYEDLQGNVSLTDIVTLDLGEFPAIVAASTED